MIHHWRLPARALCVCVYASLLNSSVNSSPPTPTTPPVPTNPQLRRQRKAVEAMQAKASADLDVTQARRSFFRRSRMVVSVFLFFG